MRTQISTPTISTELHSNSMTMNNLDCDVTLASPPFVPPATPSSTAETRTAAAGQTRNADFSEQFAEVEPEPTQLPIRHARPRVFCSPYSLAARAAVKDLQACRDMVHAMQMVKIAQDAEDLADAPDAGAAARRTADELRTSAMAAKVRADAAFAFAAMAADKARARGSVFKHVENSADASVYAMAADLEHEVATIEKEDVATIVAELSRAGVEAVDGDTARLVREVFNCAETHAKMTAISLNLSVKAMEMAEMAEQNPNKAKKKMAAGALKMAADGRNMVDAAFDVKNDKILEFATNLQKTYPAANNITPAMVARKLFCADVPVEARHIKVFPPDKSFAAMWKVARQFSFKTGA